MVHPGSNVLSCLILGDVTELQRISSFNPKSKIYSKGGETVELLTLISSGTPVLMLGLLFFLERINGKVKEIQEDVHEIKKGITWQDTCHVKHDEINRRLGVLEEVLK